MLGNSIRELLRANPRNRKVRSEIIDWVHRTRASASEALKQQVEKNVSVLDVLYVPPNTNSTFIPLAGHISTATKKRDFLLLSRLDLKIRGLLEGNPTSSFLHRLYGKVLVSLDDLQGAETHFRKAISIDPTDPAPKLALVILLQRIQEIEQAYSICKELIESGWADEAKVGSDANLIWKQYLTLLNFKDELDSVFSYTQDWKKNQKSPSVFGVARASAYRRLADKEFKTGVFEWPRIEKFICSAANNLNDVLKIEGPLKVVKYEIRKLVGELDYYTHKKHSFSEDSKKKLSAFLTQNKTEILQCSDVDFVQLLEKFKVENPAQALTRNATSVANQHPTKEEMQAKGYTIVTVKYLPKSDGFPNYVFANDNHTNSYYLNVAAFEDGNWREWVFVEKGTVLAIKHQPNNTGSAKRATEIRMVR